MNKQSIAKRIRLVLMLLPLAAALALPVALAQQQPAAGSADDKDRTITCANLIYAISKSSTCFSDKFMETTRRETNLQPAKHFTTVKLADDAIFDYPFAVMTGEGSFTLADSERKNLSSYLKRGGFLLASASCSSRDWGASFVKEVAKIFPEYKLEKLPLVHPIYHTVFDINSISLSHGGTALLEGMEIDGRIVMVYSPEGLNDTGNVNGCCCCGGNEVRNCHELNVNIFAYAVTH